MVSRSDITLNNESLLSPGSGPTVALLGATSGIALATVKALLKHTSNPTVYLVGRNATKLDDLIASNLKPLNDAATIVPIVTGDLTLVSNAQKAAEQITAKTSRLDMVIMAPGFLTFNSKAEFSTEGLDRATAIRFHSRVRFLTTLLPLLRAAPNPRVVSILGAGQEGALHVDDLGMTDPKRYGPLFAMGASGSMTTLFFEELAKKPENQKIVFIHLFPGLVTGTSLGVQNSGWIIPFLWDYVVRTVVYFIGMSVEESGERVLFAATNGRFRRLNTAEERERAKGTLIQEGSDGTLGSGAYAVKEDTSAVVGGGNKELKKLRDAGAGPKVFEYTMTELERIERL